MSQLRVLMVPFAGDNPYQKLLSSALEEAGVAVSFARGFADMKATLAKERIDVLHLHWLARFVSAGIGPLSAVRMTRFLATVRSFQSEGRAVVATVHNLHHHVRKHPITDKLVRHGVAMLADGLMVHSEEARDVWLAKYGARYASKVSVVPHGTFATAYPRGVTRDEARRRFGLSDRKTVFSFVGLIRPYKQVDKLLEAFARLRAQRDDVALLVAGKIVEPYLKERIEGLARSVPDVTLSLSFVPDEDLQYWLTASDIVVMPYSESLTSGTAVLAASFERPVLAPKVAGVVAVAKQDGGILYEREDGEGLFRAMEAAARDRDRLATMGTNAAQRVSEWTWPLVGEQTRRVYEKALGRRA